MLHQISPSSTTSASCRAAAAASAAHRLHRAGTTSAAHRLHRAGTTSAAHRLHRAGTTPPARPLHVAACLKCATAQLHQLIRVGPLTETGARSRQNQAADARQGHEQQLHWSLLLECCQQLQQALHAEQPLQQQVSGWPHLAGASAQYGTFAAAQTSSCDSLAGASSTSSSTFLAAAGSNGNPPAAAGPSAEQGRGSTAAQMACQSELSQQQLVNSPAGLHTAVSSPAASGRSAAEQPGVLHHQQQRQQQQQKDALSAQQQQQQTGPQGVAAEAGGLDTPGVRMALAALKWYKGVLSPSMASTCRFQPTCSQYSMDSYRKYGVAKGTVLTAWRLLRCNPWGGSGYDPTSWPPVGLALLFALPFSAEVAVVVGTVVSIRFMHALLFE